MKFKNLFVAFAASVLLAACGGSSETVPTVTVSGTAATGAPLANASVSLLCADGGPAHTATAGADGKYTLTIPATCAAPYMLKASAGGVTLYAFADAAGNVNITPFTDMTAGIATGGNTAAEYAAVVAASRKVGVLWNATSSASAKDRLKAKLAAMGVSLEGLGDFLHAVFAAKPGDKLDDALEALRTARGNVSLNSIVEQILGSAGVPGSKPWAGLFSSKTSLQYLASGCRVQHGEDELSTSARATVTLTLSGDNLAFSADITGVTATTSTLLAGPTGTIAYFGFTTDSDLLILSLQGRSTDGSHAGSFTVAGSNELSGTPTLSYYDSVRDVSVDCAVVESAAKWPEAKLDVPARVASVASGTTTAIAGNCSSEAGSFTYAVTALGDVKLDGRSVLADLAGTGAAPPLFYLEYTVFQLGGNSANIIIGRGLQFNPAVFGVSRDYRSGAATPVTHGCNSLT